MSNSIDVDVDYIEKEIMRAYMAIEELELVSGMSLRKEKDHLADVLTRMEELKDES